MAKQYETTGQAVEHLYQRVAENAPREELLEIIFDQWGHYGLRPPVLQVRLANLLTRNRA
jgi:hypothetical protein